MKNEKKVFILVEAVLAAMVLAVALLMLQEVTEKDFKKVSVIIQNSDDNQWSAFIYGLKMAAQDYGIEMFVVSTKTVLTAEEEKRFIESEIENGADAIILQPVPGQGTEEMLKKFEKQIPLMLVGYTASKDRNASAVPVTEPDNYAMGKALAAELLKDYNGNIDGKTLGILSKTKDSEAVINREKGFKDGIKGMGAEISWYVSGPFAEHEEIPLKTQPKVDIVAALDDDGLITAGEYSKRNDLHGAIVYGIGNSTEAIYYLDTGFAECLVVPDEFNVGYQSLTEIAKSLGSYVHKMQDQTVSHTVLRREELFLKENQEIIFTMSQ